MELLEITRIEVIKMTTAGLKPVGKCFDKSLLATMAKVGKEQGIDTNNYEQMAEKAKKYRTNIHNEWLDKAGLTKLRSYYRKSLFEGGQVIHFQFNKWQPELQENVSKAREVAKQAFNLATEMEKKPLKVLLIGEPGTGKTSLALAMMYRLRNQNQSAMFVSSTELVSMFWKSYRYEDVRKRKDEIIEAMKTVDVLVIDDFGTEGGVNGDKEAQRDVQQAIKEVATARYDMDNNRVLRSTITTTNNSIEELQRIYNPKLISRLVPHQISQQINFSGLEDVRE